MHRTVTGDVREVGCARHSDYIQLPQTLYASAPSGTG